jgi:O-antigen ligase
MPKYAEKTLKISIYPWDFRAWSLAFKTAGAPGIALFALLVGTLAQYADNTGGGPGHTSNAVILFVRGPLCLLAFLVLLIKPRVATLKLTDARLPFLAFSILYFISILWSAEPVETLGKAVEIVLAGFIFFEVSRTENALQRITALRQIVQLSISVVAVITVLGYLAHFGPFIQHRPGLFTKTTAQAPFLSGNGLGYVTSALFLITCAEWQAKRIATGPAMRQMAFALALFSVSASRTSLGILVASLLAILAQKSRTLAISLASLLGILGLAFKGGVFEFLQKRSGTGNIATLSGRTVVWTAAFRQWKTHPLLGAGGGVGGKQVLRHIGNFSLESMSSLHNGFMELLTGLGLVGTLIGVYLILLVTWRTWAAWRDHPQYSGTHVLIVHIWITTIMSTGVFGWMGYEMAFFLCIMTNLDLLNRASVVAPRFIPRRVRASDFAMAAK